MQLTVKSGDNIFIEEPFRENLKSILKELSLEHILLDNILRLPQGRVGKMEGDGFCINVLPSIDYLGILDYLRLVGNVDNVVENDDSLLGFGSSEASCKYLLQKFFKLLTELVHHGIPRKYNNQQVVTKFFKGNVNLEKSYMRYCLHDEPVFSTNIEVMHIDYPIMRAIKMAYGKLLRCDTQYKQPVLQRSLESIDSTPLTICEIDKIQPTMTRNEATLLNTFEIAKLIIKDFKVIASGSELSMNLLINSNHIFERFVFQVLQEFIDYEHFHYQEETRRVAFNDAERNILSTPDIIYDGINKAVIDIKNKDFRSYYSNSDFYQIYAYCKSFGAQIGILVYPNYTKSPAIKLLTSFDPDVKLYAVGIDITGSTSSLRKEAFTCFSSEIQGILHFA